MQITCRDQIVWEMFSLVFTSHDSVDSLCRHFHLFSQMFEGCYIEGAHQLYKNRLVTYTLAQ